MTFTQLKSHVVFVVLMVVAILTALPPSVLDAIPPDWKPFVAAAISIAVWAKGQKNLGINPNGTPAALPYAPSTPELLGAAQAAYEAYRAQSGGKSLATGAPIPDWSKLSEAIQQGWQVAASAAKAHEGAA